MIKIFKEMGVNPAQPDALNKTALFYASRDGHDQVIDYLVRNGCEVNHIDTYG